MTNASSINDHPQRRQHTRSHTVTQTFQIAKRHESAMKGPVYSLIDVPYTQTFPEDQIEDTREHAHPNNFRRHSSTHFKMNFDLADCHPFLSVFSFDHDSAAALAIVFEASIPDASYRFPCCGYVFPRENNFLLPYFPVFCFLIMFPEDVLHEVVNVRDRCGCTSLPPRVQDSLNFPNGIFVLCPLGNFSIDPFARHITVSAQLVAL